MFFTQDEIDEDGYPVRDRASSSYIATFEPAAVFGDLVKAEGIRRGADHVRQLTILGDGAAWIWNIATAKFPEATQIVDLFHAREHLHTLTRVPGVHAAATARTNGSPPAWKTSTTATSTASRPPSASTPWKASRRTRSKRNSATSSTTRPACATTGSAPAACSSAPASSRPGCKAVIGQRLKHSGMHWTVAGADAIITLRCAAGQQPVGSRSASHRHNQTGAA